MMTDTQFTEVIQRLTRTETKVDNLCDEIKEIKQDRKDDKGFVKLLGNGVVAAVVGALVGAKAHLGG